MYGKDYLVIDGECAFYTCSKEPFIDVSALKEPVFITNFIYDGQFAPIDPGNKNETLSYS